MLIIYDCNRLCWAAYHKFGHLSYDNVGTGIPFGFLRQVLTNAKLAHKHFKNENIVRYVFVWDSRVSIRRLLFPSYKRSNKKIDPKEAVARMKVKKEFTPTKQILKDMGFQNVFKQTGYEADDIIAELTLSCKNPPVVIVGDDNDLYQVLNGEERVMLRPGGDFFTGKNFEEKYNIRPRLWATVKSMAGCHGDGVPGITGIGTNTAIKIIKGQLRGDSKVVQRLRNNSLAVSMYDKLVTLPFRGTRQFMVKKDNLKWVNFHKVFVRNGFRSFLDGKQREMWEELFNLE